MKYRLIVALAASMIGLSGLASGQGDFKNDPGYLDIKGAIDTTKVEPMVNINIPKFLMNSILSDVENIPEHIKAVDERMMTILQDVKQIQVMVFQPQDSTKELIKSGVESLQQSMKTDWTQVMDLPGENVYLYARSDESGERIGGIVIIVMQESEVVIGNVVGHVPLGELMILAAELEKDGIGALMGGLNEEEEVEENN